MFHAARRPLFTAAFAIALALVPDAVRACGPNVEISFTESAPKDIFDIRNKSDESWTLVSLAFDLTSSHGGLIFDTDVGGPGENVAQPFERAGGNAQLVTTPTVSDGDAAMLMLFSGFAPGQSFVFTIDLDDRLTQSDMGQTMISGSEISGARAKGLMRHPDGRELTAEGTFDRNSEARLSAGPCV